MGLIGWGDLQMLLFAESFLAEFVPWQSPVGLLRPPLYATLVLPASSRTK
jgi:hypothetical protein